MEPVVLRTARLELSIPTESDVDAILAACQDAAIQRFTTLPSPYRREHAEGFITTVAERWSAAQETTWAIRHEGALVGMIGLHHIKARDAAEIGYWMTPAARGRGLLREAGAVVVDWGVSAEGLGLVRIDWRAVVGNVGSARAARALGFRYEGTLRQALLNSAGVRDDGWVAGILSSDDRTRQRWAVLDD